MRAPFRLATAALAATLVLLPTAGAVAQEGAGTPSGSARTTLLGAEIEITGLGEVPITRLLEATTYATTDVTGPDNPVDAPYAKTSVVPLRVGQTAQGTTQATSDGETSSTGGATAIGDVLGPLGVTVAPVTATATAGADTATATVDTILAEVSALLGGLGLDLDVTGIVSTVDADAASAVQGLRVSGLSLGLGDLGLGADVLGQLPLDTLLGLLEQVPLDQLGVADLATITSVLEGLADLDTSLQSLESLVGPITDTTDLVGLVGVDALPDVLALDALLDALNLLEGAGLTDLLDGLTALLTDLAAVGCEIDLAGILDLGALQDILADAIACVSGLLDTEAQELTAAGVPGLEDVAPGDLADVLTGLVDDLVGSLPGGAGGLADGLDDITALVDQLMGSLGDLDGLLSTLQGLLDGLAAAPLIEVSAFDIGTTAIANDSVDTSTAEVLCSPITITVLGESVSTPDCSDLLGGLSGITAQLDAALGDVAALLNTLPLNGLVDIGDLKLDVFGNLVESVTESAGVVTATAGFDLLDLEVPSITLDPSAITDTLGGLGLPDVLGTVTDVLDQVTAALESVDVIDGVSDVLATVEGLTAGLGAPGGLTELVGLLEDTLAGLDLGDLGSLASAITTPGLRLFIDPVSTASFSVDASGGTSDPAPDPDPTGDPAPGDPTTLPTTGGGAVVLGLLAVGGALGMRRRRS